MFGNWEQWIGFSLTLFSAENTAFDTTTIIRHLQNWMGAQRGAAPMTGMAASVDKRTENEHRSGEWHCFIRRPHHIIKDVERPCTGDIN